MRFNVSRFCSSGFTLMEVNLAIFIMAVGLLAMVALYPLAYRESRQSQDDVKGAAAADCVLNMLTASLSSRNNKWSDWENKIDSAIQATGDSAQQGGWLAYCEKEKVEGDNTWTFLPKRKSEINSLGRQVFSSLAGVNSNYKPSWPVDSDLVCAIVAQWGRMPVFNGTEVRMEDDHSRVSISVRVSRRANEIMGQPIYYTEVHFQGDQKDMKE